jgi:hypothetical protein
MLTYSLLESGFLFPIQLDWDYAWLSTSRQASNLVQKQSGLIHFGLTQFWQVRVYGSI